MGNDNDPINMTKNMKEQNMTTQFFAIVTAQNLHFV